MPGIESQPIAGGAAPPVPPASPWENWDAIEFDFADTYPLDLISLIAGQVVRAVAIEVETAFSPGTDFTVGSTITSPTEIVAAGKIDATEVTTFIFDTNRESTASETLRLYLVGAPVAGAGRVYLDI